jgi:hypothetical protein
MNKIFSHLDPFDNISLHMLSPTQADRFPNGVMALTNLPALATTFQHAWQKIRKNGFGTYLKRRISLGVSKVQRELTSQDRVLPDFLILGVQKGGTTSLFRYLEGHPNVVSVFKKEIKYFDCNYPKGLDWYRSHFPSSAEMSSGYNSKIQKVSGMSDPVQKSGEASPNYIFHPLAAQRVKETVPNARLILLLRDPVSRAYSHYNGNRQRGREKLSFPEAIEQEENRLAGEEEKIISDPDYSMYRFLHFSYLTRGIYIDQVRNWFSVFPREQFLILRSEDFFEGPRRVFEQVLSFLELPKWDLSDDRVYNVGRYGDLDIATSEKLRAYFRPHNQQLYEYLGRDFAWENL